MLAPLREYDFTRYPMICAHRGDTSAGAKENTLEAVSAAIDSGAEMIEVDIQFTTGGDIVCHHDEIDGGGEYERFEHILDLCAEKVYMNIELKGYGVIDELPLLPLVLELVASRQMSECVLFSSFRPDYIAALSSSAITTLIQPPAGLLAAFGLQQFEGLLPSQLLGATHGAAYAAELKELDDKRLADIKANNVHLSVYTINTKAEFDQAIGYGAQAIVTDVPRQLLSYRNAAFGA